VVLVTGTNGKLGNGDGGVEVDQWRTMGLQGLGDDARKRKRRNYSNMFTETRRGEGGGRVTLHTVRETMAQREKYLSLPGIKEFVSGKKSLGTPSGALRGKGRKSKKIAGERAEKPNKRE